MAAEIATLVELNTFNQTATIDPPAFPHKNSASTHNRHSTKRLRQNSTSNKTHSLPKKRPQSTPTARPRVIEAVATKGATKNVAEQKPALNNPQPQPLPTRDEIFIDSLLFHLTNLMHIENRQFDLPKKPLSQSHHRSLAKAYRFAHQWNFTVTRAQSQRRSLPTHPDLPSTTTDADRWVLSLARRIFTICDRHMKAAHGRLLNDPEATITMTDLSIESLRDRVTTLDGFFTIAHQPAPHQQVPVERVPSPLGGWVPSPTKPETTNPKETPHTPSTSSFPSRVILNEVRVFEHEAEGPAALSPFAMPDALRASVLLLK